MAADFLANCRSNLENVDCPWIVEMSDTELETWLFTPGPQHNKALIWVLTKTEPALREHLQQVHGEDLEKEIVRLFVYTGLVKSTESNKVLGHASRKLQQSFWESVLYHLRVLHDFESEEYQENYCSDKALSFLSSLISNSNFWDIIEKKPNLLPADVFLPPITATLEDLQKQLAEAEESLYHLSDTSDSSLGETFSNSHSNGSRQKKKRVEKDTVEHVEQLRINIDDYYKKFLQQIVPVLKKSSSNPAAQQLAQMVVTLHGKLNEFAEFLENVDKTKHLVTLLSNLSTTEDNKATKNSVHDFIATMAHQIVAISAAISANNDLLEL